MKNDRSKKFPEPKRLEKVYKNLSRSSVLGSSILPENATTVDQAKYKACEMIVRYRSICQMKQKELAEFLGIDESRMSEILHYKIELFTLERLIGYVVKLYPNLKIDLKAA